MHKRHKYKRDLRDSNLNLIYKQIEDSDKDLFELITGQNFLSNLDGSNSISIDWSLVPPGISNSKKFIRNLWFYFDSPF